MRVRTAPLVLAMMLLGPGVVAQAASHAAHPHALVVRGSSAGLGRVTISKTVHVDPNRARVRTRGHYAGFWLLSLRRHHLITGVFHLSFERGDVLTTVGLTTGITLHAGTYEVAFFSDGPARIRLPIKGLSTTTVVRPTGRLRTRSTMRDMQPVKMAPAGSATIPVRLVKGDFAVLGMFDRVPLHQADYSEQCLAAPGTTVCDRGAIEGSSWIATTPGNRGDVTVKSLHFVYQQSDGIRPGRYAAVYNVANAGATKRISAFALVVDLPPAIWSG